ncbi:ABC transporter permease [Brochothrix thermosphacta]|uniref:ABC transporter permease n=1 Tax=Brochothrix thermosphacta TaxID=2756 RepID=UPI00265CBD29|nr:ABC transporter permease [Brochothrix thermosphacta]WKK68490.1 ABC transporter permease [Brochothrix thermosphacta]
MNISLRKVKVIFMMKLRMILANLSIMIGPLMALGFVFMYRKIMPSGGNAEEAQFMQSYFLQLGLLFNIMMTGIMASSMPLAEEKEKNTLRVLMTSSVKGSEFFIGSMAPVLLIMVIVNILLLPVSGVSGINIGLYILITTFSSLITLIIGGIVGLVANTQMTASLLSVPLMMVLMMIPLFSNMNEGMAKVADYLYTGGMSESIANLASKSADPISTHTVIVHFIWLIVSLVAFLYYYKRRGLDND